uniref:uncharacterized protein LOC101243175 n=1 Tax=Ciona intestinalis TaxID=7719 RepID=UPI000EF4658A|nr:uncharacterized protein LOC101243175 [Ciona intestinalis]|eukprot:XP_026692804.1 uncharacterized protein LOC101243175 [Ciona intestinalis]
MSPAAIYIYRQIQINNKDILRVLETKQLLLLKTKGFGNNYAFNITTSVIKSGELWYEISFSFRSQQNEQVSAFSFAPHRSLRPRRNESADFRTTPPPLPSHRTTSSMAMEPNKISKH